MKKFVSVFFVASLALSLTACGDIVAGTTQKSSATTITTAPVSSVSDVVSSSTESVITTTEAETTTTEAETTTTEVETTTTEVETIATEEKTTTQDPTTTTQKPTTTTVQKPTTTAIPITTTTQQPTTTAAPITTTTQQPTTTATQKPTTTTTQGTVLPDNNVEIDELETYMLELLNADRAALGLQPLKMSLDLHECAEIRAQESSEYFSHTRPNGEHWYTIFDECGKDFGSRAGENIGTGFSHGKEGVESIYRALYNSEGHRANMMNPQFTEIAIAIYWVASEQLPDRQIGTVTQLFVG